MQHILCLFLLAFLFFFRALEELCHFFLEGRLGRITFIRKEAFSLLCIHVSDGVRQKRFIFQSRFHVLFDQHVNNGEAGHTNEHTDEAEESGHDRDGNDDPYGRQSGGGSVDTGNDDITVDLLYDEDHNAEDDGVRGLANEEDDRTGNCSDKGTEDGDDVGNRDDHADQRCVRHTCDLHEKKTDEANEDRVKDRGNEIFAEGLIRQRDEISDLLIIFFAEKSHHDLFRLSKNVFFCAKEVNGEDETEDDIKHGGRNGLKNVLEQREIFLQQLVGAGHQIVKIFECRIDNAGDGFIALRERICKILKRSDVFRKLVDEVFDADLQLRDYHCDEERKESDDRQNRGRYGKASSCGTGKLGFLSSGTEDFFFENFR